MALQLQLDETVCGALCQHPACWQSNTRQDKGLPRLMQHPPLQPDIELDLPTLKVNNMLDDYGEDPFDKYPTKYGGKPYHERNTLLPDYQKPIRTQSIKMTRAPQTSPKSSHQGTTPTAGPKTKFQVVEVQEVFEPEDLSGTWDETFIPKSYYVWVPNKKKKRRRKKTSGFIESGSANMKYKSPQSVKFRDMTESMVPREIEESRLTARFDEWPVMKKKRAATRSPTGRPYNLTPRTALGSSRMEFDQEGISELLDLPRDILIQVLENTRQSDLMSREKIREIIRRFMPPSLDRGNTNISLASNDLLQQKKLSLHEGNRNLRQPELMVTKPVFYLDNDGMEEEVDEDMQSHYGSLQELYIQDGRISHDLTRYKRPLPSITAGNRAVSAGDPAGQSKIPSISLGLPELPSGIRQTRPFTYLRKTDFDFTLAPVPTPPTSFRSTGTPGSDHGTTIRVNVPSQASVRSEHGSDSRDSTRDRPPQTGDHPLHSVSPSFSTRVPQAPATTPATYQHHSPSKSAPLLRDGTGVNTAASSPQEWPPRDRSGSPAQILRAPVNTPGSIMQEQSGTDNPMVDWSSVLGLGTIQEAAGPQDEPNEAPLPVSRGRSVRFEIPEVPPPPSSPQLSEKGSVDGEKDTNQPATATTSATKETPSSSSNNKPMSGFTVRTDATFNTTLQTENSFIKTGAPNSAGNPRDLSMVSTPEPWPQVNEADFDVAPAPSPETALHQSPRKPEGQESDEGNKSKNATEQTSPKKKPEPTQEFVNKNVDEKTSVVKKLMEDSRKAESPAPPPPSPEAKDEDQKIIINKAPSSVMTPLMEEAENVGTPEVEDDEDESSMTVTQIAPKGNKYGLVKNKTSERQIDTFVNIDIPAQFDEKSERSVSDYQNPLSEKTIIEEPENEDSPEEGKTRDVALSVQSTLAGRTISMADSDLSSSMVGPAMSQASHGPALSEDFTDKEKPDVLGDWTGVIVGSDGQDTQAMLSSSKQEMTEEGGDHEGFKEELREEYERLKKDTENSSGNS